MIGNIKMKEFKDLDKHEQKYVEFVYEKENATDSIEEFYQDNFIICDNCGEITWWPYISGGEMKICQSCINDGWGQ